MLLPFTNIIAQDPDAIGNSNLKAWYKADDLVTGNVTTWSTTYPAGIAALSNSDASAPYAQATHVPPGSIMNYNAVVNFSGNDEGN